MHLYEATRDLEFGCGLTLLDRARISQAIITGANKCGKILASVRQELCLDPTGANKCGKILASVRQELCPDPETEDN